MRGIMPWQPSERTLVLPFLSLQVRPPWSLPDMPLARPPRGLRGRARSFPGCRPGVETRSLMADAPGRGSAVSLRCRRGRPPLLPRERLAEDSGLEPPWSPAVSAQDSGCPGGCPRPLRAVHGLRGCRPGKLPWRGCSGATL